MYLRFYPRTRHRECLHFAGQTLGNTPVHSAFVSMPPSMGNLGERSTLVSRSWPQVIYERVMHDRLPDLTGHWAETRSKYAYPHGVVSLSAWLPRRRYSCPGLLGYYYCISRNGKYSITTSSVSTWRQAVSLPQLSSRIRSSDIESEPLSRFLPRRMLFSFNCIVLTAKC